MNLSTRASCWLLLFLLIGAALPVPAQNTQSYTDGYTPTLVQPGAPIGSYALSNVDTANLYNGSLNFTLPLYHVGARGQAGYTMSLKLEQRWTMEGLVDAAGSVSSWTPDDTGWGGEPPAFSPGFMVGRVVGWGYSSTGCLDSGDPQRIWYAEMLVRFTLTLSDGTEYEFVPSQTSGAPLPFQSCSLNGVSFGNTFVTRDGTSATFISDDPVLVDGTNAQGTAPGALVIGGTGVIFLKDGTRYRVDGGYITKITDRNGNFTTIQYGGLNVSALNPALPIIYSPTSGATLITDSLGRTVNISYATGTNCTPGNSPCDTITFHGYGGTPRSIQIYFDTLQNRLATGMTPASEYQIQSYGSLFSVYQGLCPNSGGPPYTYYNCSSNTFNGYLPSAVVLPNSESYQFYYNSHAELARYTLPTGGKVEFSYGPGDPVDLQHGPNGEFGSGFIPTPQGSVIWGQNGLVGIYRRLTERREYSDGSNLSAQADFQSSIVDDATHCTEILATGSYVSNRSTQVLETHSNLKGGYMSQTKHSFCGDPGDPHQFDVYNPLGYNNWREGKEFQTIYLDGSGNIMRSELTTWAQMAPVSWWPDAANCCDQKQAPANNPRITQKSTILDNGQVSQKVYSYDSYNNTTDVAEYDYGATAAGGLIRHTSTQFLTDGYDADGPTAGATIHIRDLPQQTTVYSTAGTGSTVSTTEYYYDGATPSSTAATQPDACPSVSVVGHDDTDFSTSYKTRGNLTSVRRAVDATGSNWITASKTYNVAGLVTSSTDGNRNTWTYTYTDAYSDNNNRGSCGFPTTVANPLGQAISIAYDYSLGKTVAITDLANGGAQGPTTTYQFVDSLDRVSAITRPDGGKTTFSYLDSSNTVTTTETITSASDPYACEDNQSKVSDLTYDGLGRSTQAVSHEASGNWVVQTQYDPLGRVSSVSNPYRSGSDPQYWTTTTYDSLNRPTQVQEPDSQSSTYTAYVGDQVTVVDPGGNWRQTTTDAAGRIKQVTEAPIASLTTPSGTPLSNHVVQNLLTEYGYDAQDDLLSVTQGSQTRTFAYDAVGRLVCASNPESSSSSASCAGQRLPAAGADLYSYDANSNLITHTDARSVSRTTTYDKLNRVIQRKYSDTATPTATYCYDGNTSASSFDGSVSVVCAGANQLSNVNAARRLTWESNGNASSTFSAFDVAGRVTMYGQSSPGYFAPFSFKYAYNSAGDPEWVQYPGGRKIQTCYDSGGRVSGVRELTANPFSYASDVAYSATIGNTPIFPQGAITALTFGNNIVESIGYSADRLQPISMTAGSLLGLGYSYCPGGLSSCSGNNGNLLPSDHLRAGDYWRTNAADHGHI